MPKQKSWTEKQLRSAVIDSFSVREVLHKLNLKPAGGNYKQYHKYIAEYNIDTSHFTGRGWSRGKKIERGYNVPLSDILVSHSTFRSSQLRYRLIKEKIFEHKCSRCENIEWQGQEIPLELEHINGINTDNRLENLCLLCPNCHALTSTYRGKNQSRSKNKG